MIYIFRSGLPQEFTLRTSTRIPISKLWGQDIRSNEQAQLLPWTVREHVHQQLLKGIEDSRDDHQSHGLIMDSLDQRWRIEDVIDVFDMTTTNDLVKEGEQEKENPKLESIWIIWKWTFDFREVLSHEHIWALFVNMMRMLWGMTSYGHEFLCDTLSSSRGWWDARICGAAPREAWLKLRCSLICSLSANPKSSIWMHLASCGCLWVVPRILSLQDDLRFQRNAYMYTTGMYDMSCKHEVFGADVLISSSGMDGASILDPQWSVNCHWNSFHLVFYHFSDVVSSTMSLWGAGRRTRNLQEAWDWREALVVPGRIDGLKWLSWDIRDACVSFGGMIGKLTDPFSTQSVVEKRFQRQLRWLFSDNRRFCCLKAFKRWLGQLC